MPGLTGVMRKNELSLPLATSLLSSGPTTAFPASQGPVACIPQVHYLLSYTLPQLDFKQNIPGAFVQCHTLENILFRYSLNRKPYPYLFVFVIYLPIYLAIYLAIHHILHIARIQKMPVRFIMDFAPVNIYEFY